MLDRIRSLSSAAFADTVAVRRHLHRHPELAFQEFETAALVSDRLSHTSARIRTGIARTGIAATIEGGLPGPTIALRADMDALPIHEENTFDFRSAVPGVMHACGHDAHTACLLTVASIVDALRDSWPGSVRFLFQPSEEKIPGGALEMIREGALDPEPAYVFGQHVRPDLPAGTIGIRSGPFMASADEVVITVRGQGGHAAEPHLLSGDPVTAAAAVITALQTVVSRNAPPGVPTVLSFGRITADGARNVIPGEVILEGTLRSMDENWRNLAHDLVGRVAEQSAAALGTAAEVTILRGYPALTNDPVAAGIVHDAAERFWGADRVVNLDEWYVSEDFAYFLNERPGAFYVLGTGNAKAGITSGLHTPTFTVDEAALEQAPGFMAYLAYRSATDGRTQL